MAGISVKTEAKHIWKIVILTSIIIHLLVFLLMPIYAILMLMANLFDITIL